jgi:hypothetical protein
LNNFLHALQKGIVTKDTIRKTKIYLENNLETNSTTKIVNDLKNLIPDEFINHSINHKNRDKQDEKIEVILSEYFI